MRGIFTIALLSVAGCMTPGTASEANRVGKEAAVALKADQDAGLKLLLDQFRKAKQNEISLAVQLETLSTPNMSSTQIQDLTRRAMDKMVRVNDNAEAFRETLSNSPNWSILFQTFDMTGQWFGAYIRNQMLLKELSSGLRGRNDGN